MVMQSLRSGATGGALKYLLLGLLVLAVGGFLLSDVSSSFSSGVGSRDVAKIEDKTISMNEFYGTVQRGLRNYNLDVKQAYQLGLVDQMLNGEIRARLAQTDAEHMGIKLSNDYIKKKIVEIIGPMVQEGQTIQQTLEHFLRLQGLNETQLVEGIDRELSIDIVTKALQSGYMGPKDQLAKDLFQSQNQTRDIEIIVFPNDTINDASEPTEEQLEKLYEAYKNNTYAIPERRNITLALIDDGAELPLPTDDEIQAFYEKNIGEYTKPESYVLSQILIKDRDTAQKVFDLAHGGKSLKDAVIEVTGSDEGYYHEIPFDVALLPKEVRNAVLDKPPGKITGPTKTALGNHVTQLVRIDPPSTIPLEDVREELEKGLIQTKREDYIYDLSIRLDDLLISGAAIEEISKEIPLIVNKINDIQLTSANEGSNTFNAIKDLFNEEQQGDKPEIITSTFGLKIKGENSGLLELPSGRFAAIVLDDIMEKSSKPYDDVKALIKENFIDDQKSSLNNERVAGFIKAIESGELTFEKLKAQNKDKIQKIENIGVRGILEPPLVEEMRAPIFRSELNKPYMVPLSEENAVALISVIDFDLPDITDELQAQIAAISVQVDNELKDEIFAMYLQSLSKKYNTQINQGLMRAVFARQETQEQ
ncbi:MAG: peptidyl-prolyl cis-trans isomerase [Alphaproteobacteria bacterium]|nr:peptidyl-prolyl cis-trans isomerase [Alphaproteobacteria bacterium]